MTVKLGTEGLLRDIYRDLRWLVIHTIKAVFYIPRNLVRFVRKVRMKRAHRKNYESANLNKIWESAKPGILRALKQEFVQREYQFPKNYPLDHIRRRNLEAQRSRAFIERWVNSVRPSKRFEPPGLFIIGLELPPLFYDSQNNGIVMRILRYEISHVFNPYFVLDFEFDTSVEFIRA